MQKPFYAGVELTSCLKEKKLFFVMDYQVNAPQLCPLNCYREILVPLKIFNRLGYGGIEQYISEFVESQGWGKPVVAFELQEEKVCIHLIQSLENVKAKMLEEYTAQQKSNAACDRLTRENERLKSSLVFRSDLLCLMCVASVILFFGGYYWGKST